MSNNNSRRFPRPKVYMRADWCVSGHAAHVVSVVENLSPEGVFVRTAIPAPVGSPVDMAIFSGTGVVRAQGQVMWIDGRGMGIRCATG